MDAQTLKALKASISKWERNSRVRSPDNYLIGVSDCPLCALFYPIIYRAEGCEGCPVHDRTGYSFCKHSPYKEATNASGVWSNGGREARKAARAEVEFLKSLLPEGERK